VRGTDTNFPIDYDGIRNGDTEAIENAFRVLTDRVIAGLQPDGSVNRDVKSDVGIEGSDGEVRDAGCIANVFECGAEVTAQVADGTMDAQVTLQPEIVASDVEPVREVITDGETGRLVDFFDTDALVNAVCTLLDDADARAQMGRQARQLMRAEFDLQSICLPRQVKWVDQVMEAG